MITPILKLLDRNGRLYKIAIVIREFCSLTSLHGFKYIVHVQSYGHMLLWLLFCTTGLTVASLLIFQQWDRFITTPTVIGIETFHHPIFKVPFPAVTICSILVQGEILEPCDELLVKCKWLNQIVDCLDIVETVRMPEGFCCAFNYYEFKKHNESKEIIDQKVKYVSGAGSNVALEIMMNLTEKEGAGARVRNLIH